MPKSNLSSSQRKARDIVAEALPKLCERAIKMTENDKLPVTGRAQLINSLLRVGGLFDNDGSPRDKEAHEMTPEELADAIARAEEQLQPKTVHEPDDDNGILS